MDKLRHFAVHQLSHGPVLAFEDVNIYFFLSSFFLANATDNSLLTGISWCTFWWSLMQSSYNSRSTCFNFTLHFSLGTLYTYNQSDSLINLYISTTGSRPSNDRPYTWLKSSFGLQSVRLRPVYVNSATSRWFPDLSNPICWWHADCRKKSSQNRKIKAEPSWQIHNEGIRTNPTHTRYADRAKLEDKDTLVLLVWLHTKGVEELQHGEREANTNPASNHNSNIGQRLSLQNRKII